MRGYTVDGTGLDSLTLTNRSDPSDPAPHEAQVDIHAVSLNYRDLMVADGRYGGVQETPILACSDFAGVVTRVGAQVRTVKEGDRVMGHPFLQWPGGTLRAEWSQHFLGGQGTDGCLVESINHPAEALVPIPPSYSMEEASCLPVAGLTAWSGLVTHGKIQAGQWVLLQGTGGVSLFGAQIAQAHGARTILLTSKSDRLREMQEQLGVEVILDYRSENWPKTVWSLTEKKGVDQVLEVAGGASLAKSVSVCATGAHIALIGVLDSGESGLQVFDCIKRQVSIRGTYMESCEELRKLARACETGGWKPVIDQVFPFEKAREAFEHLQNQGHMGKVVIRLAD